MMASHRIWWWLKLVLAIVALVAIYLLIDPVELLAAIRSARITALVFALLLLIPNLWFQFLKWRSMLHLADSSIGDAVVWRSLLSGFAVGIVTPARVGEFGGRLLPDKRLQNAMTMSLAAIDKFASMLITVTFGGVALAYWGMHFQWFGYSVMFLVVVVSLLLPFVGWKMLLRISIKSGNEHIPTNAFTRSIQKLRSGAGLVSLRSFVLLLAYSSSFYVTFIAQFSILLIAFEQISLVYAAIGSACVMITKTFIPPVTFGELGIREGLSVFFLSMIGMTSESVIAASLLLFTINILIPAALGGLVFLRSSLAPRYQA
jgi:uncharacterized protein (TIRG00374 family)